MVVGMPKCRIDGIALGGMVTTVPPEERRIEDAMALFGGNRKQIERLKKTIGLDRRRVAAAGTTAADLCEAAARSLICETAALDAGRVDGLICVTQMPDFPQPCNAALLHGRLGLRKDCAAFDVNLGCSGYVYGLWLAALLLNGGGCQNVLLLAGDTVSRLTHPEDRSVALLFGDGGSATWLRRATGGGGSYFSVETDGSGYQHLIVPAGGARRPPDAGTREVTADEDGNRRTAEHLFMNGTEIFNFSITEEPTAVRALLDFADIEATEVDYFVFHQANRYILGNIAKRLKIPLEKVPMQTVERFGNQSSASIPASVCGELGHLLTGPQTRRLLLSGFGVGLSWASAILDVGDLSVCRIETYNAADVEAERGNSA